jgi:hypothetical protein
VNLEEARAMVRRHARTTKERHVREVKGRPGQTDIRTVVGAYRGGEPVALIFTNPDRDAMLAMARTAAGGFRADTVALTFESYYTRGDDEDGPGSDINPDTGQKWRPGEMQAYFERHGAQGVVSEALMTAVYTRDGGVAYDIQPYELRGRTLHWLEGRDPEGASMGGLVDEAMRQAMREGSSLTEELTQDPALADLGRDMDAERRDYHLDMAAVTYLQEHSPVDAAIMLFAAPGSRRHQLLRERLSRSQVLDPASWN